MPGLFRNKKDSNGNLVSKHVSEEVDILHDFISESSRFVKDIPSQNTIAWLELAQHYGVPTRLLDFTENPLVALYFACIGSKDKDTSVWIVNETAYDNKFFRDKSFNIALINDIYIGKIMDYVMLPDNTYTSDELEMIKCPWIYKQYYRKNRMSLQSSRFMLWGSEKKENLLMQLNSLGINEKFIYPGLDGIGRYIENKYSK